MSDCEAPLLAVLRARIAADGPLPVADYMHACLTDVSHGYWHRPGNIGATGDFITAPEISQVFGELIGLWCLMVWQGLGAPQCVRLIELGPGRGPLIAGPLPAPRLSPHFLRAVHVHLVEISEPMRERQRRALFARPPAGAELAHAPDASVAEIAWHTSLADVPQGPAIVIANEFLDALPIRQLIFA